MKTSKIKCNTNTSVRAACKDDEKQRKENYFLQNAHIHAHDDNTEIVLQLQISGFNH